MQPGPRVDPRQILKEQRAAAAAAQTEENCARIAQLRSLIEENPADVTTLVLLAQSLAETEDAAEAIRHAETALRLAPNEPAPYRATLHALLHLGHFDAAEPIAASASSRFPTDAGLLRLCANVAMARGDIENFAIRFAQALEAAKTSQLQASLRAQLSRYRFTGQILASDGGGRLDFDWAAVSDDMKMAQQRLGLDTAAGVTALMMRFESLGTSCEFGLLQRHFSAEPVGLLRWNGIAIRQLVQALKENFDKLEEPDAIYLTRQDSVKSEWLVRDKYYKTAMHSAINANLNPHDEVLHKQILRVRFLRRKLLEDLAEAKKIFVVNADHYDERFYPRLVDALRHYKPAKFLVASVAPNTTDAGRVFQESAGIWRGFLGHSGRGGERWKIDHPSWLRLIEGVAKDAGLLGADAYQPSLGTAHERALPGGTG